MKKLHLTAVIWAEGGRYVSRCPEIGIASYGRTPATARRALQGAAELWIRNAKKLGLLADIRPSLESGERYTAPLEVAI